MDGSRESFDRCGRLAESAEKAPYGGADCDLKIFGDFTLLSTAARGGSFPACSRVVPVYSRARMIQTNGLCSEETDMMRSLRPAQCYMVRKDAGAVLIEFAIVFPIMLVMMIGGLDLGIAMVNRMQLEFATEATAKCFATKNANCLTPVTAAAYGAALMPGTSPSEFVVSTAACGGVVTGSFTYVPMFWPSSIPLQASACFPS